MSKGHALIAIEVKARQTLKACEESVPVMKQQKIIRAMEGALAGQGGIARKIAGLTASDRLTIRFDTIWIVPRHWPRHIKDAWRVN